MASKKQSKSKPKPKQSPLEWHLQTACYLELWTIPLYLTAAYSINTEDTASNPSLAKAVQTEVLSVAIQEMYHLQLASNLAATYGFKPTLKAPSYKKLPCLKGDKSIKVELGNIYEVIDLLIEVETPDTEHQPPTKPPRREKNGDYEYDSIGDLYNVMKTLAIKHWDDPKYQKIRADKANSIDREKIGPNFKTRYKFNEIETVHDLVNAVSAIVDQGEGMQNPDNPGVVDPRLPKKYQPKQGSRFYAYDEISHYERFKHARIRMYSDEEYEASEYGGNTLIDVYPVIEKPTKAQKNKQNKAQENLNIFYSQFLKSMRVAWANKVDPNPDPRWTTKGEYSGVFTSNFFQSMYFLKALTIDVWKTGAVPKYKEVKFTPAQFNELFSKLDSTYNFHQSVFDADLATKDFGKYDQYKFHGCEGLNMCKGMGHNNSGTQPGDGDCATIVPHTCSQGNDCKYQGGCAYSPFVAIENSCRMKGGCQTPMSGKQVLSGDGPNKKVEKEGAYVWDVARQQIANRINKKVADLPTVSKTSSGKTIGKITRQGNARRQKVRPTNPKKS